MVLRFVDGDIKYAASARFIRTDEGVYLALLKSQLQVLHELLLRHFVQQNEIRLSELGRAEASHADHTRPSFR